MLKVKMPIRELKPGDVFLEDGRPATLVRVWLEPPDEYGYRFGKYEMTEPNRNGHRVMSFIWETYEVVVVSCTASDIARRIVDELTRFDTAVIREVCAAFCRSCGERDCKRHWL